MAAAALFRIVGLRSRAYGLVWKSKPNGFHDFGVGLKDSGGSRVQDLRFWCSGLRGSGVTNV